MSQGFSLALLVAGVLVIVLGLLLHYALKSLEIFPHFSIVVGVVGLIVAALGAWGMWRARQAA